MSERKSKGKHYSDLHVVSNLSIEDVANQLKQLENKGIDLSIERIAPDEQYWRLFRKDHKTTSVYMRLMRWNTTQTRIEVRSKRGNSPSTMLLLLAVIGGGIIIAVVEFLTNRTVNALFLTAWLVVMMFVFYAHREGIVLFDRHEGQNEIDNARRQRNISYIIDAVVEIFKSHGMTILSEDKN